MVSKEELYEEENLEERDDDVYDYDSVRELSKSDEIDSEEEGFMQGYNEAIEED